MASGLVQMRILNPVNYKPFRLIQAAYVFTMQAFFGAPGLGVHGGQAGKALKFSVLTQTSSLQH